MKTSLNELFLLFTSGQFASKLANFKLNISTFMKTLKVVSKLANAR